MESDALAPTVTVTVPPAAGILPSFAPPSPAARGAGVLSKGDAGFHLVPPVRTASAGALVAEGRASVVSQRSGFASCASFDATVVSAASSSDASAPQQHGGQSRRRCCAHTDPHGMGPLADSGVDEADDKAFGGACPRCGAADAADAYATHTNFSSLSGADEEAEESSAAALISPSSDNHITPPDAAEPHHLASAEGNAGNSKSGMLRQSDSINSATTSNNNNNSYSSNPRPRSRGTEGGGPASDFNSDNDTLSPNAGNAAARGNGSAAFGLSAATTVGGADFAGHHNAFSSGVSSAPQSYSAVGAKSSNGCDEDEEGIRVLPSTPRPSEATPRGASLSPVPGHSQHGSVFGGSNNGGSAYVSPTASTCGFNVAGAPHRRTGSASNNSGGPSAVGSPNSRRRSSAGLGLGLGLAPGEDAAKAAAEYTFAVSDHASARRQSRSGRSPTTGASSPTWAVANRRASDITGVPKSAHLPSMGLAPPLATCGSPTSLGATPMNGEDCEGGYAIGSAQHQNGVSTYASNGLSSFGDGGGVSSHASSQRRGSFAPPPLSSSAAQLAVGSDDPLTALSSPVCASPVRPAATFASGGAHEEVAASCGGGSMARADSFAVRLASYDLAKQRERAAALQQHVSLGHFAGGTATLDDNNSAPRSRSGDSNGTHTTNVFWAGGGCGTNTGVNSGSVLRASEAELCGACACADCSPTRMISVPATAATITANKGGGEAETDVERMLSRTRSAFGFDVDARTEGPPTRRQSLSVDYSAPSTAHSTPLLGASSGGPPHPSSSRAPLAAAPSLSHNGSFTAVNPSSFATPPLARPPSFRHQQYSGAPQPQPQRSDLCLDDRPLRNSSLNTCAYGYSTTHSGGGGGHRADSGHSHSLSVPSVSGAGSGSGSASCLPLPAHHGNSVGSLPTQGMATAPTTTYVIGSNDPLVDVQPYSDASDSSPQSSPSLNASRQHSNNTSGRHLGGRTGGHHRRAGAPEPFHYGDGASSASPLGAATIGGSPAVGTINDAFRTPLRTPTAASSGNGVPPQGMALPNTASFGSPHRTHSPASSSASFAFPYAQPFRGAMGYGVGTEGYTGHTSPNNTNVLAASCRSIGSGGGNASGNGGGTLPLTSNSPSLGASTSSIPAAPQPSASSALGLGLGAISPFGKRWIPTSDYEVFKAEAAILAPIRPMLSQFVCAELNTISTVHPKVPRAQYDAFVARKEQIAAAAAAHAALASQHNPTQQNAASPLQEDCGASGVANAEVRAVSPAASALSPPHFSIEDPFDAKRRRGEGNAEIVANFTFGSDPMATACASAEPQCLSPLETPPASAVVGGGGGLYGSSPASCGPSEEVVTNNNTTNANGSAAGWGRSGSTARASFGIDSGNSLRAANGSSATPSTSAAPNPYQHLQQQPQQNQNAAATTNTSSAPSTRARAASLASSSRDMLSASGTALLNFARRVTPHLGPTIAPSHSCGGVTAAASGGPAFAPLSSPSNAGLFIPPALLSASGHAVTIPMGGAASSMRDKVDREKEKDPLSHVNMSLELSTSTHHSSAAAATDGQFVGDSSAAKRPSSASIVAASGGQRGSDASASASFAATPPIFRDATIDVGVARDEVSSAAVTSNSFVWPTNFLSPSQTPEASCLSPPSHPHSTANAAAPPLMSFGGDLPTGPNSATTVPPAASPRPRSLSLSALFNRSRGGAPSGETPRAGSLSTAASPPNAAAAALANIPMHQTTVMDPLPDDDYRILICVHGCYGGIGQWLPLWQEFAAHADVYAFDMPGFARSERPDVTFAGPRNQSAQVAIDWFHGYFDRWFAAMNFPKKVSLIAHSFGGYLFSLYAKKRPELFEHVFLADPWGVRSYDPARDTAPLPRTVKALLWSFYSLESGMHTIVKTAGPMGPRLISIVRPELGESWGKNHTDGNSIYNYLYQCNANSKAVGESGFRTCAIGPACPQIPLSRKLVEEENPYPRSAANKHDQKTDGNGDHGGKDEGEFKLSWIFGIKSRFNNSDALDTHKALSSQGVISTYDVVPESGHQIMTDNPSVLAALVLHHMGLRVDTARDEAAVEAFVEEAVAECTKLCFKF